MQDSITMAEVGSMVKVNGSRIATPLGPPSPGSTPTKMPSTSPTIISDSVFQVSRTPKPCKRRPKASIAFLEAEGRFQRSLRHDHVEGELESDEHRERKEKCGQERFPPGDAADEYHEAGNEQEAREIKPQPLCEKTKQQRGDKHLHDAAQLIAGDEGAAILMPAQHRGEEAVDGRACEN